MQPIPPRARASVNGQTLEYVTAGQGSPTIVLINGAGGPLEGWIRVLAPLSQLGTVFAYDRPGPRSGTLTTPQTGLVMAGTLHALLREARLPPPYVLVGHSLGGLLVNLYARLYPADVAGAVFLDATAPQDPEAMARHEGRLQRAVRRILEAAFPTDPHAEIVLVGHTARQVQQAGPFPAVPLIVLSGARPAMAWATPKQARAARAEHQRQLAALSPLGRQLLARRSGHFPQLSEPGRVVEAVRAVTDALRGTPEVTGQRE